MVVNGIELSAFDRIEENVGGFLYALKEAIVFGISSGCLLIGMMSKNLLAMGTFDLLFGSLVAVFREAENSIMILSLHLVNRISII
jgi:hypothetical protein